MTRIRLIALASASILLLTGCGSVPAFNPGVAARVGDETVSVDEVDDVSSSYCAYAESQLQGGQVIANHYLRGDVAGALALRAAVDQFVEEQGIDVSADYGKAVDQAEQQLAGAPQDQVDAVIDVLGANVYLGLVEQAVGRSQGEDGEAAVKAGEKVFVDWLADQDVDVNPRYGISIADGVTTRDDTSLSYDVGGITKKADAKQPDAAYAGALPETQRCG